MKISQEDIKKAIKSLEYIEEECELGEEYDYSEVGDWFASSGASDISFKAYQVRILLTSLLIEEEI